MLIDFTDAGSTPSHLGIAAHTILGASLAECELGVRIGKLHERDRHFKRVYPQQKVRYLRYMHVQNYSITDLTI